ncbi:MAG: arginine deiminase [Solobacterium sp.]|nr:arginine deiminase [Solobacterium sp.]
MTQGIHVTSEIGQLKKVLLHRPGRELLNLVPDRLGELLFDDIPYLEAAAREHDAFASILKDNGVEVVYLEDLMNEVLALRPRLVDTFLDQWLEEGDIRTEKWKKKLKKYLTDNFKGKDLVLKTMEGITLKEMGEVRAYSLQDRIAPADDLVIDPMPNLYFQRDPFSSVGNDAVISSMHFPTRKRETIYADYILRYHPDFAGFVKEQYSRSEHAAIEGGDILNLNRSTLAIGISQRTSPDAIELLAAQLFTDEQSPVRTVLAFKIPSSRAFMHLDTVFTQIDKDTYVVHPGILGPLTVFEITPAKTGIRIREAKGSLQQILEEYTHCGHVELIRCGGDDVIASRREQWNDGSNTLAIAPGKVIVYDRNNVTNAILREKGIEVLEMPSSELSRGRGGPRCMSMPLVREEI